MICVDEGFSSVGTLGEMIKKFHRLWDREHLRGGVGMSTVRVCSSSPGHLPVNKVGDLPAGKQGPLSEPPPLFPNVTNVR